jgi:hypothetical protein
MKNFPSSCCQVDATTLIQQRYRPSSGMGMETALLLQHFAIGFWQGLSGEDR